MKTLNIAHAAVLTGILATSVCSGVGADSPRDSLYIIPDMSALSAGVAWEELVRDVQLPGNRSVEAEARSLYGYLALDIVPWATVRGGVGQSEVKEGPGTYGEGDTMWTLGIDCSLWRHDVEAPKYAAHTLEFLVSYDYLNHDASLFDWSENRFAAIVAAEFKGRHMIPDPNNIPYSAVFSAGPVLSMLDGESDNPTYRDINEDDELGLLMGAHLRFHRNISLGWEGRVFDGDFSHTVVGAFRF